MPRTAYIAEIDPREVAALAYVAGMLQGQGVAQGAIIAGVLDRIQLVEVPDEFGALEGEEPEAAEELSEPGVSDEGGTVLDFPTPTEVEEGEVLPENAYEPHGGELPAIDPATDPTAPENLGVELNLPNPYGPPPASSFANQEDFGAGPPPRQS